MIVNRKFGRFAFLGSDFAQPFGQITGPTQVSPEQRHPLNVVWVGGC